MNFTSRLWGAAVALFFAIGGLQAQNTVVILNKEGAITQYSLQEEGKMYFENDNLMIKATSSDPATSFPLANIKKVSFMETSDVNDVLVSSLNVFPNPTADYVYVAYAKEGDKVEVLSWNGVLLSQQNYSENEGVSLKNFPAGLYIVRLNGQSYKITKK